MEGFKHLETDSVDMLLSDWPYGTTQIYWDKLLQLDIVWPELKRIVKPNGAIVLFSAQPFTTDLIMSNRKMFRYEIIWEKTQVAGFLNAKKMPLRTHENICVFYQHLPTYNPIMRKVDAKGVGGAHTGKNGKMHERYIGRVRKNADVPIASQQYNEYRKDDYTYIETGERYPTDVIKFSNWNGVLFSNRDNATVHPTQKPVDLCEYLIKTFTDEGDTVFDNCAGSGTTGVACINTNRNYILMEKDPDIFKTAVKRLDDATQAVQQLKMSV